MRFLGVAVILAIVGVLLVSSGVAPVGPTIGQATAGPAPAADAGLAFAGLIVPTGATPEDTSSTPTMARITATPGNLIC